MRLLPVLAAFVLVVWAPRVAAPPPMKDWTFLVYMDADNSLEDVGVDDFLEMAVVGSTDRINVVVQFDRTPDPKTRAYGDWTTAKRFYVTAGLEPTPGNALVDLGEVNMADPATLIGFVNWGIATYPARYYFLVLWDHGLGWQGVVVDDDPSFGDQLTAPDLRTAMSAIVAANGRRIDLLGNDACRMTLEIQYELAGFVDYFVGSEKDEPLAGWPYDTFLTALAANPGMSPPQVASALVDRYVESYENNSPYSVALSAVSAAGLRPLVASLNAFLDEVAVEEPYFTDEVVAARDATEHYELAGQAGGDEYDLYHFIENLLDRIPSRALERRGTGLIAAFQGAVVHNRSWDNPIPINQVHAAHAHGISLWFPTTSLPQYGQLAFSVDSRWDEFLANYSIGTRPQIAASATAASQDTDGDGYLDELVLRYAPAVEGTMAVDVYRDGSYALSRLFAATAGRTDEIRLPLSVGGFYEVTFYLIAAGDLVNLTVVEGLVIHELITFQGRVTGANGAPLDGTVTLINLRTGQRAAVTTTGGRYAVEAVYPTWFHDGDRMALEVRAGDRKTRVEFDAILTGNRTFVRDVSLDTLGMGPWIAAIAALAVLTVAGLVGTLYFWRRLRRFKRIP